MSGACAGHGGEYSDSRPGAQIGSTAGVAVRLLEIEPACCLPSNILTDTLKGRAWVITGSALSPRSGLQVPESASRS